MTTENIKIGDKFIYISTGSLWEVTTFVDKSNCFVNLSEVPSGRVAGPYGVGYLMNKDLFRPFQEPGIGIPLAEKMGCMQTCTPAAPCLKTDCVSMEYLRKEQEIADKMRAK